jgi:hypothetical protein
MLRGRGYRMQFSQLKRREFITLLGSAAAVWPLSARAQKPGQLPTIGFLAANPSIESQRVAAFVQRLRELGWIDGRNLAIEYRWAEGRNERYVESAAEFVRRIRSSALSLPAGVLRLRACPCRARRRELRGAGGPPGAPAGPDGAVRLHRHGRARHHDRG